MGVQSAVIAAAALWLGVAASPALAVSTTTYTYGFDRITSNSGTNVESQLGMDLKEVSGGVLFTFYNNVGVRSSITDIYFDDMSPKLFNRIYYNSDSGAGVSFDSWAFPRNLPGGSSVGFSTDYSGDSAVLSYESGTATWGIRQNGVNKVGEWVSFLGVWANMPSYGNLVDAIGAGNFKIGLLVQDIDDEYFKSDSFVNGKVAVKEINAVPLPAAAWLFGSALAGFMVAANRRRV